MKKLLSTALAGALAVTTLMPVAPAFAGGDGERCKYGNCRDRDRDRHSSRDRDDWKRHSWNRDRDWDRRHWRHRDRDRGFDGRDAAGLVFGLAAGAIAGSIAGSAHQGSYDRCAATYRSFDPSTWTYLGYDGYRHRCPY